jgi:hypothetical protein
MHHIDTHDRDAGIALHEAGQAFAPGLGTGARICPERGPA